MEISSIIFPDSLPKLDLHGFDGDSARVAIEDFISDNLIMKNEFLCIVHGIGSGVIRNVTIKTLSKNKNVLDFKSDYTNRGSMIVKIRVE